MDQKQHQARFAKLEWWLTGGLHRAIVIAFTIVIFIEAKNLQIIEIRLDNENMNPPNFRVVDKPVFLAFDKCISNTKH